MRTVLLIGGSSNQKALACKISGSFDLVGIVIEKKEKAKNSPYRILKLILDRVLFSTISKSWRKLANYYNNEFPNYPSTEILIVNNVNSKECVFFIEGKNVDLIAVSGTTLLSKSTLDNLKVKKGIMNLHTGLSPYVRGGPNCTNWCISQNKFHLIGNTIMWINPGIDSGNIISSECVSFNGKESLFEVHVKVMEHAHYLYLNALLCQQRTGSLLKSIPQSEIDVGKLFLTKEWGYKEKINLIKNFNLFTDNINSSTVSLARKQLQLIDCKA